MWTDGYPELPDFEGEWGLCSMTVEHMWSNYAEGMEQPFKPFRVYDPYICREGSTLYAPTKQGLVSVMLGFQKRLHEITPRAWPKRLPIGRWTTETSNRAIEERWARSLMLVLRNYVTPKADTPRGAFRMVGSPGVPMFFWQPRADEDAYHTLFEWWCSPDHCEEHVRINPMLRVRMANEDEFESLEDVIRFLCGGDIPATQPSNA